MGPPDSMVSIWYNPTVNRFFNGDEVIHNLSPYFTTWELDQWKKKKDYAVLSDRNGGLWELFYDETTCQHICSMCGSKCEIYDLAKEVGYYEG